MSESKRVPVWLVVLVALAVVVAAVARIKELTS